MGQTIPPKWWLDLDEEIARVDEWGTYKPRPRWSDPQDARIEDAPRWALELVKSPPDPIRGVVAGLARMRGDMLRMRASFGIPLQLLCDPYFDDHTTGAVLTQLLGSHRSEIMAASDGDAAAVERIRATSRFSRAAVEAAVRLLASQRAQGEGHG